MQFAGFQNKGDTDRIKHCSGESCENQVHARIALWIKASCKSVKTSADLNSLFSPAATPEQPKLLEECVRTTDIFAMCCLFWYVHTKYFAVAAPNPGS